ncbi:hypothetical protein D5F01_LYC11129 [Larimichthys crocea]|uniref:PiggyBac transposable element-derived protein domain-containing protein n=1 Tax=Larimichthys crocea TaxID=215358 RepID=A0A6G0ID56_LARCR|nr:hypothetical protein D5F01_LYC11129 [Larimichthys crocea]
MDEIDLHDYMGLLILVSVYRSRGEATASLWDVESGRTIFRATMSLKVFYVYLKLVRFDDRETRAERRVSDKLAVVRKYMLNKPARYGIKSWVAWTPCSHSEGDSKFAFTHDTVLVSYRFHARIADVVGRRHRADNKPAIILAYNSNKGGVDNLDKVVTTYSYRRMTARWPLAVFHNILDVSFDNAFVISRAQPRLAARKAQQEEGFS